MGLTQEDLADGICSVPTLSRIENGERMPTKNHFDMLMQRLGYSDMYIDFYTNRQDFQIHELKNKIQRAYILGDYEHARNILKEFESLDVERTQIDQQFLMLYQVLLYKENYTNEEMLALFEKALHLTCPGFINYNQIPNVLSYVEIILLNNIAVSYSLSGNRDRAISILMSLKVFYDYHVVSSEEALRTQPMILYNLSKELGQEGRYDECIGICDLGIQIAKSSNRCQYLSLTLYNRGWALLNRGNPGDWEAARYSLKQSYQVACIMGYDNQAEHCQRFWEKHFSNEELH